MDYLTDEQEFNVTSNYAAVSELGWNATIGPDSIALHIPFSSWGWNARAASSLYLAVEFSQPIESRPINDDQVRAFAYFFLEARKFWRGSLPLVFPTHAELDGTEEYGGYQDGKTDVFSRGSFQTTDLRNRILAHINYLNQSQMLR